MVALLFDTTKPPLSFGSGDFYTKPLRIYLQGGFLWLFDDRGYLCRIYAGETGDEIDLTSAYLPLLELLRAEAASPLEHYAEGRKHFRQSARNLVDPGYAERMEAELIELDGKIQKFNETNRGKRNFERQQAKPPTVRIDLASLGLIKKVE